MQGSGLLRRRTTSSRRSGANGCRAGTRRKRYRPRSIDSVKEVVALVVEEFRTASGVLVRILDDRIARSTQEDFDKVDKAAALAIYYINKHLADHADENCTA